MRDEDDVDATVREGPRPLVRSEPDSARLARGTPIGRYIVLEELGAGGMGIVYAAYDPELDRRVAIKLLNMRARASDQPWLVREAQALARLSHPNVIAVHDVGTLPGDRVFVAMELVQGETMRDWLRAPRPWREVLDVAVQAGRGLGAAHASGLVHRDFKPDNVLVGEDRRVRVMDFGLARLQHVPDEQRQATRESDLSIEARSPLSMSLTVVGDVFGTPAYMAPEIYTGVPAGPRSDQFAFGVTLFEALYGARPFGKRKQGEALPEPVVPPGAQVVPVRVHKAVLRAIAAEPEARFPSMEELLAEITIDPEAGRRRLVVGLGVGIGMAGIAIAAISIARGGGRATAGEAPPELCTNLDARLVGIWDDGKRGEVRKAFAAVDSPFVKLQLPAVERAFDAYAKEWAKTATDSCRATRITGEQSDDVMDLRQACLERRLVGLQAQVALFAAADSNIVEKADAIVGQLEPLQRCSDVEALRSPTRPSKEAAAKLRAIEPKVAKARAQLVAGQYLGFLAQMPELVDGAKAIGYDPLIAEVQAMRGQLLMSVGKNEEALGALAEATWAGLRGRRDDLVANAAFSAAQAAAIVGHKSEADLWLGVGSASVARMPVKALEMERLKVVGIVAGERGDMVTAVKAHEEALAGSPDEPLLKWSAHQLLGATLAKSGAWARAVTHYEKALAIRVAQVGPEHPDVALVLGTLGAGYDHLGEAAKGRETLARALAIREKTFGADSPKLMVPLNNLADLHKRAKRHTDAIAMIQRARALADKALPPGHPTYHVIVTTHAEILDAAGRRAEARKVFDKVQALEVASKSPVLATTLASRAALELADRKYPLAAKLAQQSVAGFEAAAGDDSAELWRPLTTLGLAKLALRDSVAGRKALERAIAIGTKARVVDADLAPARAALAKQSPR